MPGCPTGPGHDRRVNPGGHERIAATHRRGIWIANISDLQKLNDEVLAEDVHLFPSPTAYQFGD